MSLPIDLSQKTALITGSTGQLGRTLALTLARAGADVILHYRGNENKAWSLQAEIEAIGRKAYPVQADITEAASVQAMSSDVATHFAAPDIVIACAVSQIHPWSTVLDEDIADYEDQFRSCVLQNVLLSKAFVPAMIEKGWGRYIGINSECSMQLAPTMSAYGSAKRAMDGVLRVLAREVGSHQVTVNQVAPGWTISDHDRENHTEENAGYSSSVPLRRRGTDQELANVVAFLASDLASFVTGAFIPVCGGNVMPSI